MYVSSTITFYYHNIVNLAVKDQIIFRAYLQIQSTIDQTINCQKWEWNAEFKHQFSEPEGKKLRNRGQIHLLNLNLMIV